MLSKLRKLIPHWAINYGKHLPEALLANLSFGFPGRKLKVIGVTGTDGKTTTVNMIYKILKDAGRRVSMISTINAYIGNKSYDTGFHVTNPQSKEVQKFLREALDNGDEFMVLEVTSHGLKQFRVWGINFEMGVITNITHEHLDYHGNFLNYLKAKAKLIRSVKYAVLNHDDPNFNFLSSQTRGKVISFGLRRNADVNPQKARVKIKIPGTCNLMNALAAFAATQALGVDKEVIKRSLVNFSTLPGRMEEIKNRRKIRVIVDFAHTPNALEQVLTTLRGQTSAKLICVFGAASERDRGKRPLMGEVSLKLADITILTDEDPRFESSEKIIEEIAKGAYRQGALDEVSLFKEPDRFKAIKKALALARTGDTVGIFGKGHEGSMSYKGVEKPWSDRQAVLTILKNG